MFVELTCFDDEVNRFEAYIVKIIMCIQCNEEENYTYAKEKEEVDKAKA